MSPAAVTDADARRLSRLDRPRRGIASSNASKIAVCIAGTLRTFLKPSVQRSFRDHVHHNGFEYFLSTDFQPDPKEQQAKLLLEPIRAWVANGESTYLDAGRPNSPRRDELPRGRCPRGTCNPNRYLLLAMRRVSECFYSLQKEEGRQNERYGMVLRMRPDHFFLRPLPRPTVEHGWLGHRLVPGRVLLWDDQFAASLRDDAAAILLAPTIAYATCADEAEWVRAARNRGEGLDKSWSLGACREGGAVPCTAMALVTIFGAATSWRELQLEPRGWLPNVGPARPASESFCQMRARERANETRSGAFFDGVGMSC